MRRAKFLTLDDYIYFLENPEEEHHGLTIDHLNQILQLHGFCKVQRQPKKVVMDALRSIPMLMTAFRSSIKQEIRNNNNISSCCSSAATATLLTKNEVIKDLSDLQWQEYCSLQSIETLTPPTNNNNNNNNIDSGGGDKEKEKEKEEEDLHLRRSRRRRSDDDIIRGGNKLVMLSSKKDNAHWGAKRKRNSININNRRRRSSTWV